MQSVKRMPKSAVAARYGVTIRTVDRWRHDENLGFPKPMTINARHYFDEAELDDFDRQCVRRAVTAPKAA